MVHLRIKLPVTNSSTSLAVAIKPRAEDILTLRSHRYFTLHDKITFEEVEYFQKICFHTSFHNPKVSDANVYSTSDVCMFTISVFLLVGNEEARRWNLLQLQNIHNKFRKNRQLLRNLKWDTYTA
jgi:hypothetical protein